MPTPLHDLNGDGRADIVWRNDDGRVRDWSMTGVSVTSDASVASVGTDWKVVGVATSRATAGRT